MAPRYLTYEQQGLANRIPQIDYAGSQAAIRRARSFSENLQQMSSFFLQMSQARAEIEGERYGELNAPTQQQLIDAAVNDKDIELVGDDYSVFGQAARKAALSAASDEMELLAKSTIAETVLDAEKRIEDPVYAEQQGGIIEIESFKDALRATVEGFASVLEEEEPGFAKKFRAALGIYGNAEIESYSDKYLAWQASVVKVQSGLAAELFFKNEKFFVAAKGGNPKDGVTISQLIENKRETFLKQQAAVPNRTAGELEALANRFDETVENHAKDIIEGYIVSNPRPFLQVEYIKSALAGERFGQQNLPIEVNEVIKYMGGQKKLDVLQTAQTALSDYYKQVEGQDKQVEEARKARVNNLDNEINTILALGPEDKPPSGFNSITDYKYSELERLTGLLLSDDAEKANEYSDMLTTMQVDGKRLNFALKNDTLSEYFVNVQLQVPNTELTLGKLNQLLFDQKITYDFFKKSSEKVSALQNERVQEALDRARLSLDIPPPNFYSALNTSALVKTKNLQIFNRFELDLLNAISSAKDGGADFDAVVWFNENFERIKKSFDEKDTQGTN
jgi:hypothetical protein